MSAPLVANRGLFRFLLLILACTLGAPPQANAEPAAVGLGEGLWVQTEEQRAYLSNPQGFPEARDLRDGTLLWTTQEPALLLAPVGARWLALGHSMGGHLLTRWVGDPERAQLRFRKELDGLVLAAPFFGLGGPVAVRRAALSVAPLQVARGKAADFAWGQTPYGTIQRRAERQLLLTGSRAHFEDEGLWVEARPELATGGVSWGWINAFSESRRRLEALPLETLDLPVLMLLAAKEKLVDNKAAIRVATRMPNCRTHIVMSAAHELLREAEPARQEALGQIRDFAREFAK